MSKTMEQVARENRAKLSANPYPGRGIVIGTSQDGMYAVQIYWIMGRSENSRNRVFKVDGTRLYTEAFDPTKVKDPSLIIYNAMSETFGRFVVSNGSQTDEVIKQLSRHYGTLQKSLAEQLYEPDTPNFTPRITGVCTIHPEVGKYTAELSILRKSEMVSGDNCERSFYEYNGIMPGLGFCITTYSGDGNPLPAFEGSPYPLPIIGRDIRAIMHTYWSILNEDNRVSLAVRLINLHARESSISVINKNSQAPTES